MTKDKFLWGSATSAYQCEGGWNADDKGISNWDDFCHSEKNNINCVTGDVASDFYHRYEEDIKLLSQWTMVVARKSFEYRYFKQYIKPFVKVNGIILCKK